MRQRLTGRKDFDYTSIGRSNDQWPDHRLRTLVTGAAIAWVEPESVIDPACGDGSIVRAADRLMIGSINKGIAHAKLTDISQPNIDSVYQWMPSGWSHEVKDIHTAVAEAIRYDVIVLTEILEHLEDPDALLRLASTKARYLVASSPEMRDRQVDGNNEHLWMFDRDGYRGMLGSNGWQTLQYTHLNFPSEYDFQIWVAEARP